MTVCECRPSPELSDMESVCRTVKNGENAELMRWSYTAKPPIKDPWSELLKGTRGLGGGGVETSSLVEKQKDGTYEVIRKFTRKEVVFVPHLNYFIIPCLTFFLSYIVIK